MTDAPVTVESKEDRKLRQKALRSFVLNSELISGRGFENPKEVWQRPSLMRHIEIADIVTKPRANYVPVQLINGHLSGRSGGWYRTGIEALMVGRVPHGRDVSRVIDSLNEEVVKCIPALRDASPKKRREFSWNVHDRLMCIHAFKERNGRTARVVLIHIRALLGLPIFIVRYKDAEEYYAKLDDHRRSVFIPNELPRITAGGIMQWS